MADVIQLRRDTAANWTTQNPTLAQGEMGLETDTKKIKVGDGTTAWSSLDYWLDVFGLLTDTTPQLGGVLDANGNSIDEAYAAITSSTGTVTLNCANGNHFSHTLSENTTLAFSNVPASGKSYVCQLDIIQDASASGYTFSLPAPVKTPGDVALTLTSTASAIDSVILVTRDGGTNWSMFTAGQDIK